MKSAIARAKNDGYRVIMELRDKRWSMFWRRSLNDMIHGYIVRLQKWQYMVAEEGWSRPVAARRVYKNNKGHGHESTMLSLSSILSSLFRLCSYIFLQVIPTRRAVPLLPALYLLYLITACLPGRIHRTPPVSPISTILFSLPTRSRYLQCFNLIINTLLFLAALDFAVTPFVDTASDLVFTRVGALYPDSAKIVVRYPKANATENTILLVYRETPSNTLEPSPPWKDGPHLQLNQSFDWVGTVRLAGLWPGTSYECQFSL